MEELSEGHSSKAQSARLPEAQQTALAASKDFFSYNMRVVIPQLLPQKPELSWLIWSSDERQTHEIDLELKDGEEIAKFGIERGVVVDGKETWIIMHRFVAKKYRHKGIGSYMLSSGEQSVLDIARKEANVHTVTMEIPTPAPSVVTFALDHGYTMTEKENALWEKYKKEAADPANAAAFKERGELPSFLLVKRQRMQEDGTITDTERHDLELIDKEALAAYGERPKEYELIPDHVAGNPQYGVVSQFKVLRRKYKTRPPFLVYFYPRKDIPIDP